MVGWLVVWFGCLFCLCACLPQDHTYQVQTKMCEECHEGFHKKDAHNRCSTCRFGLKTKPKGYLDLRTLFVCCRDCSSQFDNPLSLLPFPLLIRNPKVFFFVSRFPFKLNKRSCDDCQAKKEVGVCFLFFSGFALLCFALLVGSQTNDVLTFGRLSPFPSRLSSPQFLWLVSDSFHRPPFGNFFLKDIGSCSNRVHPQF